MDEVPACVVGGGVGLSTGIILPVSVSVSAFMIARKCAQGKANNTDTTGKKDASGSAQERSVQIWREAIF